MHEHVSCAHMDLVSDSSRVHALSNCVRTARRGVVFRVLFHPKQLMVISGGDDAEVRIWDLVTKTCMATLKVPAARRPACRCPSWQLSRCKTARLTRAAV